MLVDAHRFITLNRRLGNASTLTPGDIVDLAAFYGAGFPSGDQQKNTLCRMLRQLDIPLPDFARDLHRVKALYDFLGGPKGGIAPPSFSSHPTMGPRGQKGEGALQRKSTIFARDPDEYEP